MSEERLPVHVDPVRMAETGRSLRGHIALAELSRLGPLLTDTDGEVAVELQFGVDVEGIRYLDGHINGTLHLTCQRCLEVMNFPVEARLMLALVREGEATDTLPERYEPLVYGRDPLFLRDVIEDELILSLPVVPRHAEGECADEQGPGGEGGDSKDGGDDSHPANPFAILSDLIK